VSLKSGDNNGTVHEDQCTLLIKYRSSLLKMRNVSDKICRENSSFIKIGQQ